MENQDQNGGEGDFDTNITALTVGVGFRSRSGLTLMVGYRADYSGEEEGEERIHGVMATAAFTVR